MDAALQQLVDLGPGWLAWMGTVAALATARLTRLAVQDEITRKLREAVFRRLNAERGSHLMLVYLMTCGWCTSVWAGGAVVSAVAAWPGSLVLWIALSTFAASQITGTIGDIGFYLRNVKNNKEQS
jgi:hypothetical protein